MLYGWHTLITVDVGFWESVTYALWRRRLLKQLFQLTGWCQSVWCHLLLCHILTNTITDGTPGGNDGLVQAPLARCSVSSSSQTILSHKRWATSATGKTKVLIRKVRFAGWIWKAQAPTDQRLALRNMTKSELRSLFELSQKLRPQDADRF